MSQQNITDTRGLWPYVNKNDKFKLYVGSEWDLIGSFTQVSGIAVDLNVSDIKTGANGLTVAKSRGIKHGPVTLTKAFNSGTFTGHEIEENGELSTVVRQTPPDSFFEDETKAQRNYVCSENQPRRDYWLVIYGKDFKNIIRIYKFEYSWPSRWELCDLDSNQSEVMTERVTLQMLNLKRYDISYRRDGSFAINESPDQAYKYEEQFLKGE